MWLRCIIMTSRDMRLATYTNFKYLLMISSVVWLIWSWLILLRIHLGSISSPGSRLRKFKRRGQARYLRGSRTEWGRTIIWMFQVTTPEVEDWAHSHTSMTSASWWYHCISCPNPSCKTRSGTSSPSSTISWVWNQGSATLRLDRSNPRIPSCEQT